MSRWVALLLSLLFWSAQTGWTPMAILPGEDTRLSTSVTYDPDTGIRRTTLETGDLNVSIFFEVPVFPQKSEGYSRINAYFQELTRSFFSPQTEDLRGALWHASRPDAPYKPYFYEHTAEVSQQTGQLVSVVISYFWYMGGVADYGSDSYTFRTDTGELLRLTDLLEGSEEELKAQILAAVAGLDAEPDAIDMQRLETYALDDFEFCVSEGRVWILFDKYEAADGAFGGFQVELPGSLKPLN